MSYKGKDVRNVFHLQTPEDANSIAKLANNKNAVVVGTSFVGETKTHPNPNLYQIKNNKEATKLKVKTDNILVFPSLL